MGSAHARLFKIYSGTSITVPNIIKKCLHSTKLLYKSKVCSYFRHTVSLCLSLYFIVIAAERWIKLYISIDDDDNFWFLSALWSNAVSINPIITRNLAIADKTRSVSYKTQERNTFSEYIGPTILRDVGSRNLLQFLKWPLASLNVIGNSAIR